MAKQEFKRRGIDKVAESAFDGAVGTYHCPAAFTRREIKCFLEDAPVPDCSGCVSAAIWWMKKNVNVRPSWVPVKSLAEIEGFENKLL
jgi:hypothetical protein